MFLSQAPDLAAQARALQEQKTELEKEIADLKKQLENESKVKLSLSLFNNTSTALTCQLHLGPLLCLFSQSVRSFRISHSYHPLRSIIKLTNYWLIRKTGP